ncbi:hypothetical protein D3Z52_18395 [Clostridiaceae bacterium]|nr:hypothetical protein [Clostridiaceae bacterium]
MCSLFGIIDYRGMLTAREKNRILSVLARECEVRGTDATGIAYNVGNRIHVYKRPVAARKMHFHVPNGVRVIMGHTRMTTQGSARRNCNNHPWATRDFALAHNGILQNDIFLRESEPLPPTHIETDSYVAVQLLEQQKALNFQTIRTMAEKVQGSFVFTILDRQDNLYFVRGDNPLAIFDYGGFYLYASTDQILDLTEQRLGLCHRDEIPVSEGDILCIKSDGTCHFSRFQVQDSWRYGWPYGHAWYWDESEPTFPYSENYLLDAARSMGVSSDDVQTLIGYGYSADEIEELLYYPHLLHDLVSEIRCDQNRREVSAWA